MLPESAFPWVTPDPVVASSTYYTGGMGGFQVWASGYTIQAGSPYGTGALLPTEDMYEFGTYGATGGLGPQIAAGLGDSGWYPRVTVPSFVSFSNGKMLVSNASIAAASYGLNLSSAGPYGAPYRPGYAVEVRQPAKVIGMRMTAQGPEHYWSGAYLATVYASQDDGASWAGISPYGGGGQERQFPEQGAPWNTIKHRVYLLADDNGIPTDIYDPTDGYNAPVTYDDHGNVRVVRQRWYDRLRDAARRGVLVGEWPVMTQPYAPHALDIMADDPNKVFYFVITTDTVMDYDPWVRWTPLPDWTLTSYQTDAPNYIVRRWGPTDAISVGFSPIVQPAIYRHVPNETPYLTGDQHERNAHFVTSERT